MSTECTAGRVMVRGSGCFRGALDPPLVSTLKSENRVPTPAAVVVAKCGRLPNRFALVVSDRQGHVRPRNIWPTVVHPVLTPAMTTPSPTSHGSPAPSRMRGLRGLSMGAVCRRVGPRETESRRARSTVLAVTSSRSVMASSVRPGPIRPWSACSQIWARRRQWPCLFRRARRCAVPGVGLGSVPQDGVWRSWQVQRRRWVLAPPLQPFS